MAREYKEIYMGVAPVTRMNATNVYMADGSTAEEAITTMSDQITALNSYNIEEQRVGTWINGKPIYRKTIPFENIPSSGAITIDTIDTIDDIVNISGSGYSNVYRQWYNIPNTHNDISYYFLNFVVVSGGVITLRTGSSITLEKGYCIIEYTKTTDTANRSLKNKINKLIAKNTEKFKNIVIEETEGE